MDIEKEIKKIIDCPATSYEIEKSTGLGKGTISRLRNGDRTINKLTVETAQKILNYSKNI